jgi:hypothetical protein
MYLSPSDEPSAATWVEAKRLCDNKTSETRRWRLPNVAELGKLQENSSKYGLTKGYYWSATSKDDKNAFYWSYDTQSASYTLGTYSYNVRCVSDQ